jgi:hypothetical protein
MSIDDETNNSASFSVRADELSEAYGTDPASADEKFLDEELVVTGEIHRVDNVISAVVPRMLGTGEKYSGTHVKFHLETRENVEQLTKGEQATIRGTCGGFEESTSPTGERIGWITIDSATVSSGK